MDVTISEFFEKLFGEWTFGGERFWVICSILLALILFYQVLRSFAPKTVAPLSKFFKKHPLVWICIPAALLIYFVYVSIGWNIMLSVSEKEGLQETGGFAGFVQYSKMFNSENADFWHAVANTLVMFLIIPICLVIGLGLALVMDHGLRGTGAFRTLILLPFSLSFVVTGKVWQYMYTPTGGVINTVLEALGVNVHAAVAEGRLMWTSDPNLYMICIIIAMTWQFSGYVAVIFLAAIKNVPTNIINAAKLDGAYMPRIYFKMVIPQLKGAMGSCITILAMYALRSFDLIVTIYNESKMSTATLPVLMYYEAFTQNNFPYSAAISCFLLALVLVLILPLTYWTNKRK